MVISQIRGALPAVDTLRRSLDEGYRSPARSTLARRLGIALALLVLCALSWLHQAHYDFEHDDAYISYRYALNWAAGYGPVFNPGERIEGYSNFLHVLALRECKRRGLDIVASARLMGTLSYFTLIGVAFWFVTARLRRPPRYALAAAGLVATHAALATWARSGLETLPFALLVLLAMHAFVGEHAKQSTHFVSGALFGIASLERADGFLFALATLLFVATKARSWRRASSLLLAFAVLFVPHLCWRLRWYGYPFPNSYYLKTGGGVFQQIRGLFYAYNFVEPFGGLALFSLPLLLVMLRDRTRNDARAYLAFVVVTFGAYIVWAGGDHMPMSRFFVPLIVPLTMLFLEAAVEMGKAFESHRPGSGRYVRAGVLLVAAASNLAPTLNQRRLPASYAINSRALVRQWSAAGAWLRANFLPSTVLATEPAGAVAYASGFRIIDMLGVNDAHIAHAKVANMGHGTAGHEKRDMKYVLSRMPDLIFRGVRPDSDGAGNVTVYEDGSRFRLRCASLGVGPIADEFGTVTQRQLFIRVDVRAP